MELTITRSPCSLALMLNRPGLPRFSGSSLYVSHPPWSSYRALSTSLPGIYDTPFAFYGYKDMSNPLHKTCYSFGLKSISYKQRPFCVNHSIRVNSGQYIKPWKPTWWKVQAGGRSVSSLQHCPGCLLPQCLAITVM